MEPEGVTLPADLRRFDEAERKYDDYNVQAQWFATDAWNFTFGATGRDEDYDKSKLGLLSDDVFQYNAEAAFVPSDAFSVYRWTADFSVRRSDSNGNADFTAFPGGLPLASPPRTEAQDFSNYEDTELTAALAKLNYKLNDRFSLGLGYLWEDYNIDSFILQDLQELPAGSAAPERQQRQLRRAGPLLRPGRQVLSPAPPRAR